MSEKDRMMSDKETLAKWMMANGFATGHGDSVGDMLNELSWQIDERIARAIAVITLDKVGK